MSIYGTIFRPKRLLTKERKSTMSLGIAFKGPEGIVLAADSRVTLNAVREEKNEKGERIQILLPSTFDNATKLLEIRDYKNVGVVTYGLGVLGHREPRTPHSFVSELEEYLREKEVSPSSVADFADALANFFEGQWTKLMPKNYSGIDLTFLVGGYDKEAVYGKVFEINIPSHPKPKEWHAGEGVFGPVWGGQLEITNRLIHGFDPRLPSVLQEYLKLSDDQANEIVNHLRARLQFRIPYQFLSLQDCIDLSTFLIRTTINFQNFLVGVRGVGGDIDVAIITRTKGFEPIQLKKVVVERKTGLS